MHIPLEGGVSGDWAKIGENIKNGDRIQIKNAGQVLDSSFKDDEGRPQQQYVFKIMTSKKEEFNLALNRTSRNNLARGYGQESDNWVGKIASCFVVKQMVGDKLRNVLYLAPDGWTMTEDGEFVSPEVIKNNTDYPTENINPDDIPF